MKLFKKITFLMVLCLTTSLNLRAETADEESYNTGILSNDELPRGNLSAHYFLILYTTLGNKSLIFYLSFLFFDKDRYYLS